MSSAIRRLPQRIDDAVREPWQMRALATVDAVVVNLIILAAARFLLGELPQATVGGETQSIGLGPVIIVTGTAGLIAGVSLGVLQRMTTHAKAVWTMLAAGAFLVSLIGPAGSAEDGGSGIALACLHVGAAAVLIPLMRKSVQD